MTKQEFLAMSLPYGLIGTVKRKSNVTGEFLFTLHNVPNNAATVEVCGREDFYTNIECFKPALHHVSDITKEIEHNGDKFVPIIKIAYIIGLISNETNEDLIITDSGSHTYKVYCDGNVDFTYDAKYECFSAYDKESCYQIVIHNQLQLFLKLIEWHFDVAGLIEKGEAFDVNTLPENPYK